MGVACCGGETRGGSQVGTCAMEAIQSAHHGGRARVGAPCLRDTQGGFWWVVHSSVAQAVSASFLCLSPIPALHDALAYHPHTQRPPPAKGWVAAAAAQTRCGFYAGGEGGQRSKAHGANKKKGGGKNSKSRRGGGRRKGKKIMGARVLKAALSAFVSWFPDLKAHKFSRRSLRFFVVVVAFVCLGHIFSMFMSLFSPLFPTLLTLGSITCPLPLPPPLLP